MKGDKQREMSARHSNPQQTTPPQFPQTAPQFPQPQLQPHQLGLQESNWSSVNLNFTPAAQLGRITPEAAMGGGGYIVGGVNGEGWTPWGGGSMPAARPNGGAYEGPSSRNSPTYPEARDPFDFSGVDFNVVAAKKEKKKKKRREGDDEASALSAIGARGSIGGATAALGRESTWHSFGSSMTAGPPGVAGTFAGIEGMSDLQRSLDEIMPALTRSPPPPTSHTRATSPIPSSMSPQPYAYQYGSPGMPVPVIPIVSGLDDEASIRAAKKREKEERKQEKRRQEKKKDRERRIERQISAGQRNLDESLNILQAPATSYEEYYRRALGPSPTPGSRPAHGIGEGPNDSGDESDEQGWARDELLTPPPSRRSRSAAAYANPDDFAYPQTYCYTSPQRTPSPPVPGHYTPASRTPPGRSIIPPIPTLPAEPLVPIPPIASPIPDEKRRKSRSKETGKRRKSKRASDDSEEEGKEVFIPPGFEGDEYPQQQRADRIRPMYQYQQQPQEPQHNIYQQHAQQSSQSYFQPAYPPQQQQQQSQHRASSSQHQYQHSHSIGRPSYQHL
ncbi:hypothetical protein BKA70DRAFT_508393 [Coprinopsis sp. MPI-PUGE-AT-0042]|nr:hypothetical protein BKA70DRAFT_508393 [Coprinopsis sp. MPI-PUGE-AT-0042]